MFLHQTFVLLVKTGEMNVFQYKKHLEFIVKHFEVKDCKKSLLSNLDFFLPQMINGDLHWLFLIK